MKTTVFDESEIKFAALGRAAVRLGIQYAIEILQKALNDDQIKLAAYQGMEIAKKAQKVGGNRGWSEDPEERKAEAQRRQAVAKKKNKGRKLSKKAAEMHEKGLTLTGKPLRSHPRDVDHPKHQEWIKRIQLAKKRAKRARAKATPENVAKVAA